MSIVEDAMTAIKVGVREKGITAMHDATECGIWGGLYEIAQAAGLGVRIEKDKIVVEDCVQEICQYFGIDPYASISEGTMIASCRPQKAEAVVKALAKKGIKSSVVGELIDPKKGMILVENGKEKKLKHPIVDPFWRAFYDAMAKS
jgi:hydrogenase maturation factor